MLDRKIGDLHSSPILTRHPGNPILKDGDVPYARGLVYNGGVIRHGGRYVMLVRVDHADVARQEMKDVTDIALAFSDDGVSWEVQPRPAIDWRDEEVLACSDPRLMPVEGRVLITVAVQTRHGMETWCVATEDFRRFAAVFKMVPDNRDVVIFPERIGGKYRRLERPFPTFGHGRRPVFDIWLTESPDLTHWGNPKMLLDVEHVPYANLRIGPGTPPLRTERGWLLLIHAVNDDPSRGKNGWEPQWTERYAAGVLLLDLDDPGKVIGLSPEPLLAPEASYETRGYRNDIVFPCGWVLEGDGTVKIYYGAADTVQCLATARLEELIGLCEPVLGE